jgi:hypothetical protein
VSPRRAGWDFGYAPPSREQSDAPSSLDVVVATARGLDLDVLRASLRGINPDLSVETVMARSPLFWTRIRGAQSTSASEIADALTRHQIEFRYVTSARAGSMSLPPALVFSAADVARPVAWAAIAARPLPADSASKGQWFLRDAGGVSVDRRVCGTGAGTRLAVVDDDAADIEHVQLDEASCVGVDVVSGQTGHAALMIAWAVGTARGAPVPFVGVAPDASVRLYCVPKAGKDVISIPRAIAHAVFDGADIIVCPTYLEGTTSPMLDDALDVALHLGRQGRGAAVVLPTGRETSSPGSSVHASLSLGFGDPASDPRVHCVAPGAHSGGWFLWRGPRGTLRPFSNRGPAVRWLSPGDDISYPFSSRDRLFHAESSGASAIAAGVMLLVLGSNPALHQRDLHQILARTVDKPSPDVVDRFLADPADLLPLHDDPDGHSAKTGYGRLNASRACACALDPVSLGLSAIGEDGLAADWCSSGERPYSQPLARWAVQVVLGRPDLEHALRSLIRHVRLTAAAPGRAGAHAPGALGRQLGLFARELARTCEEPVLMQELERLAGTLARASALGSGRELDQAAAAIFEKRREKADGATPTAGLRS